MAARNTSDLQHVLGRWETAGSMFTLWFPRWHHLGARAWAVRSVQGEHCAVLRWGEV